VRAQAYYYYYKDSPTDAPSSSPTAIQAPFYYLPNEYHFDGTPSNFVSLTDLVCVKGNNARSFKFQMRTSTVPDDNFGTLIGIYILILLSSHVNMYLTNNVCD